MKDADTKTKAPGFLGYPRREWIVSLVLGAVIFCAYMLNEDLVSVVLIYSFGTVILLWWLDCVWALFCGVLNLLDCLLDDPNDP